MCMHIYINMTQHDTEVAGNTTAATSVNISRSRNWVFTLNNYTNDEYDMIKKYDCKYLVVGEEVGENGTPHLQGYIEFNNAKMFSTLKKLNPRLHLEKRRGSAKQASDYCKKDGKFFEKGERSNQGKRTDLDELAENIVDGMKISDIVEENPKMIIKFSKGINELIYACQKDRTEKPKVIWIYGLAGTGKTRFAFDNFSREEIYIKDDTQWWNGYQGHRVIVIDDFDGKWPYRDLLRLLDRYPYQGQTKGGYVKINSEYIIITCEYSPEHYWENNELAQVMRRIDKVYCSDTDKLEII